MSTKNVCGRTRREFIYSIKKFCAMVVKLDKKSNYGDKKIK